MSVEERQLLNVLAPILNQDAIRARIDAIARQVEQELAQNPVASDSFVALQPHFSDRHCIELGVHSARRGHDRIHSSCNLLSHSNGKYGANN
jgi:hypothetical protein